MITEEKIKEATVGLLQRASTTLPSDILAALKEAYEKEDSPPAKMQLKAILDNVDIAGKNTKPICQDTGVPLFYVKIGKVYYGDIGKAINEGVMEATKKVPLRPNAVHPLSRKNPGNNVGRNMPYINYKVTGEPWLEIIAFPKGAGSENMSALAMLVPSQGVKGVKEFVLNTVVKAGSNPCPPTVIGVGVGGSADIAMKLAKEALLRPITQRHEEPEIAKLETELKDALNMLGIGPMGLGGRATVLGVNVEYAYCHTASLPVAVNVQCWAARKSSCRIHPDGKIEYL
ncbi:MAG: fumarate hydratase [Thermoplasmata archaeon]|nr:fumarate hydratase [Thermoplasmata archaeon]